MMKKITLLLFLLTVSYGYSQELANYSFDDAASITNWNGVADAAGADSSGTNPLASIDYNAAGNGTGALEISGVSDGPAGKSFIFELLNTGFDYQNAGSINIAFDAKFIGTYANAALHFLTLTSGAGDTNFFDIQGQINDATWSNINVDIDPITNANTTIKISFQIAAGAILDAGGTVLIDNIVITGTAASCSDGIQNGDETGVDCGGSSCATCLPTCEDGIQNGDEEGIDCGGSSCGPCAPTVNAPTPSTLESEVLSVYSDAYTVNTVSGFVFQDFAGGGPNSEEEIEGGGNGKTGKLTNLSYYGPKFDAIDVSIYNWVHLDYYATTSTMIQFFVIDGDLGACCGDAREPRYTIAPSGGDEVLEQGVWKSVDIPLTHFINNPALAGLIWNGNPVTQLKIEGNGNLFFDNIYFSVNQALGIEDNELASFKAYPNPTDDSWTVITKNQEVSSIQVFDILGKKVLSLTPNTKEVKVDGSDLNPGLYFAQIKTINGINSVKLIKQ